MPPRRTPRRAAGTTALNPNTTNSAATKSATRSATKRTAKGATTKNTTTSTTSSTSTTAAPTSTTAPTPRITYESTPVPQQATFPARRKTVRTYGGRRSLPARLETTTSPNLSDTAAADRRRRGLRQQTLTQVGYVRSSSGLEQGGGAGDEEGGLLLGEEEVEGLQRVRGGGEKGDGGEEGGEMEVDVDVEMEMVKVVAKKKAAPERRSKRRRTMGDVPTPKLERKGSSFHTQTLTQFMGASASRLEEDGLRVEDDDGKDVWDVPSSGATPVKQPSAPRWKGKGKAVAPDPCTPSNKRIKVNPDEVPASQPTPFTPLLGHSPLMAIRSPLTQKSTNLDAPLPTIETVSKLPRTLTIQDSYSMGDSSSVGFPSSAAGDTPKKEETQQSMREPLSEIPVASIELGVGSTPIGETPTARRKRMYFEIPDTDDELDSIASTPFKTRSTQQTPLKREVTLDNFEIAADPGSASRISGTAVSATPASSAKSDKENGTPAIGMWQDEDMDDGTDDREGTPTPTQGRKSQAASRVSQVSPNTASQFWTGSAGNTASIGTSAGVSREPLTELALREESVVGGEDQPGSPSPAPLASQFHGSMGKSDGRIRRASLQFEDPDETASEAEEEEEEKEEEVEEQEEIEEIEEVEEEHIPVSILKKPASQQAPHAKAGKRRASTPKLNSESSADEPPGTPTPVVRRVQIELPPSSPPEVYKETPRKPHKSSPIYQRQTQRQTQARSQFYSQGLESQRIPLSVIRSLGPQTDRSDILTLFPADIVEGITNGVRDHEFRNYKFPIQISRCWIYTDLPVGEVKYMATLGPAKEPGQIDGNTGVGNAEFNAGTSGFKFAHKIIQVYQLNNPVPLADMEDNGLGSGPPQHYKYLPPAIVGQLVANLRCPLFAEEYEEDFSCGDFLVDQADVTISQELEHQLRSDILHSTQKPTRNARFHDEEEIIPASQSPTQRRSAPLPTQQPNNNFARPPVPAARSSQRIRDQHSSQASTTPKPPRHPRQPTPHQTTTTTTTTTTTSSTSQPPIRPSQATTASDISTSTPSSPNKEESSGPPSVPRPPLPGSSDLSLPSLPDEDDDHEAHGSLLPRPRSGLLLSSSQGGGVLPPDSLLVDEVRMAPPPVEVWDSEEEEGEEDDEGGGEGGY